MVSATGVQKKLLVKVFNALGSNATLQTKTGDTRNTRGDNTPTYSSASTITIVPWSYTYGQVDHLQFGELQTGESDFAIKHTDTVNMEDKINYDGKVFLIKNVGKFPIKNANLVYVVRVAEQLTSTS